jgi:hypothetical protein
MDSALVANGVRLNESSYYISTSGPDRDSLVQEGFSRLTKTQNERDLMPLEQRGTPRSPAFLTAPRPIDETPSLCPLDISTALRASRTTAARSNRTPTW